jgi:hypothetical protein
LLNGGKREKTVLKNWFTSLTTGMMEQWNSGVMGSGKCNVG